MSTVTTQVSLAAGTWTLLGVAPMDVVLTQENYGVRIHLRESDAIPAVGEPAHYTVESGAPSLPIRSAAQIWATVGGGVSNATATLDVTTGIELPASGTSSSSSSPVGAALDGSDNSGVAQPTSGGVGIRGWLSGIYGKLLGTLSVAGAVTANVGATNGLGLDTSLQSILAAIKSTVNLSGTVWYDQTVNPPVYYVRRETVNEGSDAVTIAWFTAAGVAAAPTIANLAAVSNASNIESESSVWTATAAGAGYATGDTLFHTFGIDTSVSGGSLAYSFWLNGGPSASAGTVLASAPTPGTFVLSTQAISAASLPLPNGAAADGTDATGATQMSGGVGIRGWLSGIYSKLSSSIAVTGSFYQPTQPTTETYTYNAYNAANSGAPISIAPSTPTLICASRVGRKEVTIMLEAAVSIRAFNSSSVSATIGALIQPIAGEAITISGGDAVWGWPIGGTAIVSAIEVF